MFRLIVMILCAGLVVGGLVLAFLVGNCYSYFVRQGMEMNGVKETVL
jgi:hypothetical protein